jgi:hypothetical protein
MHAELYTDGIDEIAVSGTIVRLDLVSLSPSERDVNNNLRLSFATVDFLSRGVRGLS